MRQAASVAVLLALGFSTALGVSKSYDVVPYANCVAEIVTSPNGGVTQYYRNTLDSIAMVSFWVGDRGNGEAFDVEIWDSAGSKVAHKYNATAPSRSWSWLNIPLTQDVRPVRGRTYRVTVKHQDGLAPISFAYDSLNPYKYGSLTVNGTKKDSWDLALRVYGLHDPVDSTYWGMDDWCFVPWWSQDSANRDTLRGRAASLADSAGVGTMMTYARWPELVGDNETTLSWSEFDAHLWQVESAGCRPVVNITEVAKNASSRQAYIWKWNPNRESVLVWDTAVYCAPKNLYASIDADTNYWARYIEELVTHEDAAPGRPWQDSLPCDFVHTWEIWNEPNDTCVDSSKYLHGTTGWWRRPNLHYLDGYGDLPGLCELYTRMAYVAAEVIRSCPGHADDTILIGSTHRSLDSTPGVLVRGIDFVREVYEAAPQPVFWDGISFHPYQSGCGFRPGLFEESAESLRTVARLRGDYDCQLWCTEVSVYPEDMASKQYYQMRYLPQVFTTALASQALPGAGVDQCQWWTYSQINDWWPDSLGLIGLYKDSVIDDSIWRRGHWGKHSSFYTFRTLTEELTDHRFERRVLADDAAEDSLMRVHEFSDPGANDRRVWVGWAVDTSDSGNIPVSITAQAPVRTDSVLVTDSMGSETEHAADADGWLRLTLTRQVQYMREVGPATRPDLVVDSIMVPVGAHAWSVMDIHAFVKNIGNASTPDTVALDFLCDDSVFRHATSEWAIDSGDTYEFSFEINPIPGWMHGWHLFSARVNHGQTYVEKDGMDDNVGYVRRYISWGPYGNIVSELCGYHSNEPLPLLRFESHSYEADTTGQTPCDSARLVQWWYGLNDTVVHGGDTTAWFCVNQAVSLDSIWSYLSGQGKYKMFLQVKDSWSMSDLIPDTVHPFVVFDTTAPTGSIAINGGARFAPSSTCTLTLAACDSASGVGWMRFMNRPQVDLAENGGFSASLGSWSFTNGAYDTSLAMARLSLRLRLGRSLPQ